MSTNLEQDVRCKALKQEDAPYATLKSQMPELSRLFANLDAGYTPNILDMIAAISEMVAFYTESDQIPEADTPLDQKRSIKICPFCC